MPNRRQFLTLTGTTTAAVLLAGCGTPDHPLPAAGAITSVSGSVTNPTGTVNGLDLSKLKDAYTGNFGGILQPVGTAQAQWNYLSLLSATMDPCSRKGSGGAYAPDEGMLHLVLAGYADLPNPAPWQPPADAMPMTLSVGQWLQTSDQTYRQCQPSAMKATRNGKPGNSIYATAGSVTWTRIDATAQEGSYDLTFGTSPVTGSFVAPWCGAAP